MLWESRPHNQVGLDSVDFDTNVKCLQIQSSFATISVRGRADYFSHRTHTNAKINFLRYDALGITTHINRSSRFPLIHIRTPSVQKIHSSFREVDHVDQRHSLSGYKHQVIPIQRTINAHIPQRNDTSEADGGPKDHALAHARATIATAAPARRSPCPAHARAARGGAGTLGVARRPRCVSWRVAGRIASRSPLTTRSWR
jgi:hypothetical protein